MEQSEKELLKKFKQNIQKKKRRVQSYKSFWDKYLEGKVTQPTFRAHIAGNYNKLHPDIKKAIKRYLYTHEVKP